MRRQAMNKFRIWRAPNLKFYVERQVKEKGFRQLAWQQTHDKGFDTLREAQEYQCSIEHVKRFDPCTGEPIR